MAAGLLGQRGVDLRPDLRGQAAEVRVAVGVPVAVEMLEAAVGGPRLAGDHRDHLAAGEAARGLDVVTHVEGRHEVGVDVE